MYEYKARVTTVVDGDTVDVEIDLGFRITTKQRCRLSGINAPETKGAEKTAGGAAKDFVFHWLQANGWDVLIRSEKPYADDKYGRFLVIIYTVNARVEESLNAAMVRTGHAVIYP